MNEHEQNEQGACPQCGSPSHAGHAPECPANTTLSSEEAQGEAEAIRARAATRQATRERYRQRNEPNVRKIEIRLREQEAIAREAEKILSGEKNQPLREDYEFGNASLQEHFNKSK